MNYVGSISILDRGDAPAQAVIDRNARSLAQRVADETKEELAKVLTRVDNIYGNFELSQSLLESNKTNLECVQDLVELESLLQDQVKKKKYQQQVTIFIVGYENVCGQKLRLLQQVNEFFVENATLLEEDDMLLQSPDLDLEEMEDAVEETLKQTENLAQKLANLKKGLDEHMHNLSQIKGSTKAKKTKELEKDLNAAKKQLEQVNNSLRELAKEVKEKSEKIDQLQHDIEKRNVDVMRYKKMAEEAKKMSDYDALKAEAAERNEEIRELKLEIERLKAEMGEEKQQKEQDLKVLMADKDKDLERIKQLEFALDDQIVTAEQNQQELKRAHEEELEALKQEHERIINELKQQHADEIRTLLEQLEAAQQAYEEALQEARTANIDLEDAEAQVQENESRILDQEQLLTEKEEEFKEINTLYIEACGRIDELEEELRKIQSRGRSRLESESDKKSDTLPEFRLPLQKLDDLFKTEIEIIRLTTPLLIEQGNSLSRELSTEPGDRSRPITKEAARLSRQPNQDYNDNNPDVSQADAGRPHVTFKQSRSRGSSNKPSSKESSDGSISFDEQEPDPHKQPSRGTLKTRSSLEPVQEIQELHDDGFDLKDEPAWASVSPQEVPARFIQYRQLTKKKLEELEAQIDYTVQKTTRKINTLKAQFQEHKSKWEKEREVLLNHLDQAEKLQTEAEKEADIAINQLEEIIHDQEELEAENEEKRLAQEEGQREASLTLAEAEENLNSVLEEQQLLRLTDDAKAELSRRNTKIDSEGTESADKGLQREETMSRASTCSHASRRQVLSALKASAEERRSKSPSVYSIRSRKSVLSEAELDENGDMPFPKDESKEERESRLSLHDAATSPMQREKSALSDEIRPGIPMHEHPVVQEFIETYNYILQFKDQLSQLFMDKDMTSLSHMLNEIEPVEFNKEKKVQPQVEDMHRSVQSILDEILQLVNNILSSERSYPVSSLIGVGSKEPSLRGGTATPAKDDMARSKSYTSQSSATSKQSSTKDHLRELQEHYLELQKCFEEEQKKHEVQLNHNTVVMLEMQDTINNLKRELSAINKEQETPPQQSQSPEGPVMFTRLDSERNAKIMKRAVNEKRLDPAKYEMALEKMEDYNSLPAKRLGHLVNKYVHHVHMKEVEENVRKSKELDEEVFQVLDKMEALQNERAKRWADRMDQMGEERIQLMSELMSTLNNIEQESGIFLIKPMYSYKGEIAPDKYQGKLSRVYKPNQRGLSRMGSGFQSTQKHKSEKVTPAQHPGKENIKFSESQSEEGLLGTSTQLLGDYPQPVWNQRQSTTGQDSMSKYMSALPGQVNTPRILELDINRMLIGQNQVSLRVPQGFVSNDRLANAANTSIRSYVTVNRPSGQPSSSYRDRPRSHTGMSEAPPATPLMRDLASQKSGSASSLIMRSSSKKVLLPREDSPSSQDSPVSRAAFSSTSPLPPIGGDTSSNSNREDNDSKQQSNLSAISKAGDSPYPPPSPPGSSLRQTPGYTAYSSQTPAQA